MKKALCVILVFVLVFVSNFNMVIAAENIQFDDPDSAVFDPELAQHYLNAGQNILSSPQTRFTVALNIKPIKQIGESWSEDIMQTAGLEIGTYGCALTSSTMIANYYGYSYTPGTFNTALGDNACELIYSAAAKLMGKSKGVYLITADKISNYSLSEIKQTIIGAIDDKEPVLVMLKGGAYGSHFVVASGYTTGTTPTIQIKDPMGKWSTMESYLNQGYTANFLLVYR